MLSSVGLFNVFLAIFKYSPQAWMNYRKKSTQGWSNTQVLLDFFGATLSLLQLVIDSGLQGNWSRLASNPVKLGVGGLTVVFTLVFLCQHYILYKHARIEGEGDASTRPRKEPDEETPLLQ